MAQRRSRRRLRRPCGCEWRRLIRVVHGHIRELGSSEPFAALLPPVSCAHSRCARARVSAARGRAAAAVGPILHRAPCGRKMEPRTSRAGRCWREQWQRTCSGPRRVAASARLPDGHARGAAGRPHGPRLRTLCARAGRPARGQAACGTVQRAHHGVSQTETTAGVRITALTLRLAAQNHRCVRVFLRSRPHPS